MNGEWCKLSDSCGVGASAVANCPAEGYECCKGCTVIENSEDRKWGVESNKW